MNFKKITIEKGRYELGGGMGSWAKSFENGVTQGDVRLIGGVLMYAYTVYPRLFKKTEINWTPCSEALNTPEELRTWVSK